MSASEYESLIPSQNFGEQLNGIVDTPLTAENISTYAEDALTSLVSFIEKVESAYNRNPTILYATSAENENTALTQRLKNTVRRTLNGWKLSYLSYPTNSILICTLKTILLSRSQ
jgi:hypothetical protein